MKIPKTAYTRLLVAILIYSCILYGKVKCKYYDTEFDLNPIISPMDFQSDILIDPSSADLLMNVDSADSRPRKIDNIEKIFFSSETQNKNNFNNNLMYNNNRPYGTGNDFDKRIMTTNKNEIEISYDIQANQLLEFLNSASLVSLNNAAVIKNKLNQTNEKLNLNYFTQLLAINHDDTNNDNANNNNNVHSNLTAIKTQNNANNYLTQQSIQSKANVNDNKSLLVLSSNQSSKNDMNRLKMNMILNEINNTLKIDLNDRKTYQNLSNNKTTDANAQIQCLNCTLINNSSECQDFVELEYNELINMFCCQCNSNSKDKLDMEKRLMNVMEQSREKIKFHWYLIIVAILLLALLVIVLLVIFIIWIYRFCKNSRKSKNTNDEEDDDEDDEYVRENDANRSITTVNYSINEKDNGKKSINSYNNNSNVNVNSSRQNSNNTILSNNNNNSHNNSMKTSSLLSSATRKSSKNVELNQMASVNSSDSLNKDQHSSDENEPKSGKYYINSKNLFKEPRTSDHNINGTTSHRPNNNRHDTTARDFGPKCSKLSPFDSRKHSK